MNFWRYTFKRITDYIPMSSSHKAMRFLMLATFLPISLGMVSPAFADGEVPVGSALRKELFALARPKIEREAGQAVRFQGTMQQREEWVFFKGTIVDAHGAAIPVGPGESAETAILWEQRKGKWTVLEAVTGFTDVIWLDWTEKHRAPSVLFE